MTELIALAVGATLALILRPVISLVTQDARRWWMLKTQPMSAARVAASAFIAILLLVATAVGAWFLIEASKRVLATPSWTQNIKDLGPAATMLAAIVALAVGWGTISQKYRNDARDQWWKRAQWALDWATATPSEGDRAQLDERVDVALAVLRGLAESPLASADDAEMIGQVLDSGWLRAEADTLADEPVDSVDDAEGGT